jgi:uncharacterized protein involved in exopolysaccharide biosynthesis
MHQMPETSQLPAALPSRTGAEGGRAAPGLDAADYLSGLWKWRVFTASAVAALALFGAAMSLTSPLRYEASVTLAVTPARVQQATATGTVQAVATFAPLLSSHAAVEPVVREFKLADPPRHLTPGAFIGGSLTVRPLVDTNLIRVVVALDDPQLAARVTNRLVERATEVARGVNDKEVGAARADLDRALEEAATRLRDATAQYDAYRRSAQVELLRKDVETLLQQRGLLRNLLAEIAAERGRVAQAEAELATRERITTVTRSIDSDSALLAAAQERKAPDQNVLGLELRSELVNEVYQDIDGRLAESRARVAALERQRDQLLRESGVGARESARLNELYARESELARLELQRQLARRTFEEVSARHQSARLEAIGRTPQVVVVDAAVPPEAPADRLLARNVAFGILAGLLVGLVVAIGDMALGPRLGRRPA